MINLVPCRIKAVPDTVNTVYKLESTNIVLRPGNIIFLRWGTKYILEPDGLPQGVLGVLIRAVDLHPGDIDEIPPHSVHRGSPDLGPRLLDPKKRRTDKPPAAEMPGLLSRLEALTNS